MSEQLEEVIEILKAIRDDEGVPKKVKERIGEVIGNLKEKEEISLKINKCLDELEEIAEDINLQTFIRTQVWNASSLLEKINC